MSNIKLELRNVAAGYEDKPILKNVNCIVRSGEICCLLGPNGVGKTTLFKTILGLIPPVSGQVLMDGRDTSTWTARQLADNIAYVSQFHNPPFPYKVKDVVLLGRVSQAGYFGKVSELDYEIAQQAMVDMGVIHLAEKPYTDISGGERQLVMIARALTQQPKWLMMDEPTASLDYGNMIRVISRIVELRDRGYGIIMTTHLPDQAFMCDAKVGLLQRGSSMKFGDAAEIITEENMRETYGVGVSVAELFDRSGHLMRMCVPEIGSAGDPAFRSSFSETSAYSEPYVSSTSSGTSAYTENPAFSEQPASSAYIHTERSVEQVERSTEEAETSTEETIAEKKNFYKEDILHQNNATSDREDSFSKAVTTQVPEETFSRTPDITDRESLSILANTTPDKEEDFSRAVATEDPEEFFDQAVVTPDTSSDAKLSQSNGSVNQSYTQEFQETNLHHGGRRDYNHRHHWDHRHQGRHDSDFERQSDLDRHNRRHHDHLSKHDSDFGRRSDHDRHNRRDHDRLSRHDSDFGRRSDLDRHNRRHHDHLSRHDREFEKRSGIDRNDRHEHRHRAQQSDSRHSAHSHPQRKSRTSLKTGRSRPAAFRSGRTSPPASQENRQKSAVYTQDTHQFQENKQTSSQVFSNRIDPANPPELTIPQFEQTSRAEQSAPQFGQTSRTGQTAPQFGQTSRAEQTTSQFEQTYRTEQTVPQNSPTFRQAETYHQAANEDDRWKPSRDSYARQSATESYRPRHHHHDEGRHHRRHRRNALKQEE